MATATPAAPLTSAFSNDGADIIHQHVSVASQIFDDTPTRSAGALDQAYEIDRTVDHIISRDYHTIALQFPDELLHNSVLVHRLLRTRLPDRELYVLADTSYGSCCVDEVAAQHVNADVVVHYGHACLSPTARLPVIYVFGKRNIDIDHCVHSLLVSAGSSFDNNPSRSIIVRYDVSYAYSIDAIVQALRGQLDPSHRLLVPSVRRFHTSGPGDDSYATTPFHDGEDAVNPVVFYVGRESLSLTNLIVTHAACQVYNYDPEVMSASVASARTNKILMRRYALVQRARDADVFGIIVGTLAVASYLPLMTHLRKLLAKSEKKSYTISVGKLNPAKLANFAEIECFVLVACPENSLIDSKNFFRPIITPYELEIALNSEPSWSNRYLLDFQQVLSEASQRPDPPDTQKLKDEEDEDEDEDEEPMFSLTTGKFRKAKKFSVGHPDPSLDDQPGALQLRSRSDALQGYIPDAGGQFLAERTFRGLDRRLGQDAPGLLEEGRSGIAKGYEDGHRA
ncbi:diphthamide biosynthesis protein [Dacryopinax primogenitus]|uniref:2-(3-amino-3-carboxypropyl)histidine synthase subunit 2 n=1 Tax=Dacryopinax primogenitus (strain DJM 731) TaxID=1858805 RepID=M5G1S2_DACPD|nr:diphthamide biosynthesis protein [Dacryopinax primogenitus]EJU04151.1 diphthamide biosynthesis protein [Dacryopinax primogenitus]